MPLTYVDPWAGVTSQYKLQPNEDKPEQNSGFFGDLIDSVQQGAYQSVAGDAEAIGQVSGSDAFKEIGKTLAKQANSQSASMTDESRQALSQHIFKEDPDSLTGVAFDDGASNWRTWALQFGVLGGQVVGTIGTGLGVGSVAKFGAKTAIKAFAKEAVTKEAQQLVAKSAVKEAIRNGALNDVRQSLLEAPTKQAVNEVLNKATSRLNGIATTAVAGAMAAGMRAQQARDEYMSLDQDALNANPEFQKMYWEIADAPENQGLDTSAIYNAAKEQLAERAATDAFFDKKALLSDLASGAYVPGVGGILERGAATASKLGRFGVGLAQEGATEAWQGGETQRAVNEAIREWGDESRDPMASVIQTRWEEGVLGGLFGGAAKVFEGQRQSSGEPIVRVEETQRTGNSALDQALAQSDADEQARYSNLTDHVDALSKPAFMRNGEISAELENAITQFRMDAFNRQQQEQNAGVMKPFNNPVTGNPDEPAFLRSEKFNPTGRDLSGSEDVNPASPVQEALARSATEDRSVEAQLAATMAKGNQGKTPQEDFVVGELLRREDREPIPQSRRINEGVTIDGQSNEILPESRGIDFNGTINMSGARGDSVNSSYVPPVTADRVTPDKSLDIESTRDPRSRVAQAIDQAGTEPDAIFNHLKSLRVTRRGNPFASVKEAQLASRQNETPIALPSGGYGVVDKVDLEQAQAKVEHAIKLYQSRTNQANTPAVDVNESKASRVVAQNQPDINVNEGEANQASIKQSAYAEDKSGTQSVIAPEDWQHSIITTREYAKRLFDAGLVSKEDLDLTWSNKPRLQAVVEKVHNQINGIETEQKDDFTHLLDRGYSVQDNGNARVTLHNQATGTTISIGRSKGSNLYTVSDGSGNSSSFAARHGTPEGQIDDAISGALSDIKRNTAQAEQPEQSVGEIVEHQTGKGKVLRGVIRTDLSVDEAKAIDPYTFKKDGGYFIREKHLDKLPALNTSIAAAEDFSGMTDRQLSDLHADIYADRTFARRDAIRTAKANGEDIEAARDKAVAPFDTRLNAIASELKKRNGLTDELSPEEQAYYERLKDTFGKAHADEVKAKALAEFDPKFRNSIWTTDERMANLQGNGGDPVAIRAAKDEAEARKEKRNAKLQDQELVTKSTGNSFSKADDAVQWGKQRGLSDTHYVVPEGDTWTGKAGFALKKLPEPNAGEYEFREFQDKDGVYRTAIIGGNQDVIHAYAVNQFGYGSVNKDGRLTLSQQKELKTKNAVLIPAGKESEFEARLKRGNTPEVKTEDVNDQPSASNDSASNNEPEKATKTISKKTSKGDTKLKQDWGVEMIDGYSDSVDRETGNDLKDSYLKDATNYLKAVEGELTRDGFVPHLDKKGKPQRPVTKNEGGPAVSGDAYLMMRNQETGVNVYVNIGSAGVGFAHTTPSGISVMYRVSSKPDDISASSGRNVWARPDLSAAELAAILNKAAERLSKSNTGAGNVSATNNEQGLSPADREGVSGASERRGTPSQLRTTSADLGNVEAGQSEDVSATEDARDTGKTGLRSSGENVSGNGQADRSGVSGDRREGDSRAKSTDAGAGSGTRGSNERGTRKDPVLVKDPETVSPANAGAGNFHITDPLSIVGGTPVSRFNKNKAAIELYNQLRDEGRQPTKEEQAVLAGYTGWGSFGQELFQGTWERKRPKAGWEERDNWLRDQLGKEEWEGLQRSITNAHYTDPPTVMAMWDMVKRMGFNGGRVLEPSMGIGNFFGMMPEALKSRSKLAGIELDMVTGGMAKMLYPDANINIMGYQESKTPDNFYDLIIGNWPFENTVIADRRYNRLSPYLHDYFFLKAVDQVRAGGIVIGITSKGTMDKQSSAIRSELAKKAELVAAFRLPSGAFEEYAGTSVVTDIIILRKRDKEIGIAANEGWIQSVPYPTKQGQDVFINEYYKAHPDHVIGTIEYGHGTTFNRPGMIVTRPENMMEQLKRIVSLVPENAFKADSRSDHISYITNHTSDREGALIKANDGFFVVRGEYLAPASEVLKYELKDAKKTQAREDQFNRLIDIRKAYGELISHERSNNTDEANKARKALNKLYTDFVDVHGNIGDSYGLSYLKRINDPFYPAIASLEVKDGEVYRPATILSRSTIRSHRQINNPTISDAYILSRNKAVNPSLSDIAAMANKPEAEVKKELISSGAVYELPNGDIAPSDLYLSGNVREKLRQALAAKEQGNTAMDRNIEALRKVIPEDIPYFKIEVQLGASWVPTSVYEEYIAHMLGLSNTDGIAVTYNAGRWRAEIKSQLNQRPEAKTGFGTPVYTFSKLVNAALSNQTVTIRRSNPDGSTYVAEAETAEVNNKISEIRQKFGEWIWLDPERRSSVESEYNEVRNAYASPNYDGSFMSFEGMSLSLGNGPFNLREHQVNAIWRALVTRKSLNAHEVGTGKTFTMGGIAVESRRYGIAKKPMILAHNANSKSVAAEIQQMYPAAKVLYIDNLSRDQIATRMRQIANDDWDAIVLPHSLISSLSMKEETLMAMAQEEIDAIMDEAYAAAEEDGVTITPEMLNDESQLIKLRSATAKELVKTRNKIIENIKKQAQSSSKENSIPFEELGVDMLLVDEAHEFKKPPISTRMRMKGLNTTTSDRSIALMFLTRYIRSMNNGGNVHLFTGTPITNTLTEVFHQMRYIMNEEMKGAAIDQWDGWFGSFAKEVMDVELNAAGEYEAVTRLAGFINVPELRRMIGQYMDVVYADDMPEMKPRKTKSGKTLADDLTEAEKLELLNGRTEKAKDRPYKKVINETSDLTESQKAAFRTIQGYAQKWRNMRGKDRREAMMRGAPESPIIYENLAAKVSFDARLLHAEELAGQEGNVPDDPNSKASRVVSNVLDVYNSDPRATQVIFTQQGLGKTATRSVGPVGDKRKETYKVFSTIHDIIERLVQRGIPRDEIALVDGSTSKDKRKEIADAMNESKIRVVIGSTQSLGVGVNMQRNLRAMHHMDAPWMPGDLEQRNGRGHRQGNQWNTVLEYRYLTDRIDGRRWQVLAIKQKFINAFLRGTGETRIIEGDAAAEEESDILESFAEAAGDPRILIRTKLQKKLEQVKVRERLHGQGIADAKSQIRKLTNEIQDAKDDLASLIENRVEEKAAKAVSDNAGKNFSIVINKKKFTERKDANDELIRYYTERMSGEAGARKIGEYAGYPLTLEWLSFDFEPTMSIDIDGTKIRSKPSIASLESTLRNYAGTVEAKKKAIDDKARSLQRAKQVASQPFHQIDEMKALESQLDDLEIDLQNNPVAPPAWLRAGAPVESIVYYNGKPYEVTGHRWSDEGWFVLSQNNNQTIELPYMEVNDAQGMPLYEEREFEEPEVVQQVKSDDDTAKLSKIPLTDAEKAGRGMKSGEAMLAAKEWLRQFKTDIQVKVARNQDEFNRMMGELGQQAGVNEDEIANAAYIAGSKTLLLNASAIQNPARLRQIMRHEILGHHGLEYVIGKGAMNDIIRIMKNGYRTSKAIKAAMDSVTQNYGDADADTFIHEVFAHYAENRPVDKGPIGRLWDRIVELVKSALVKTGFIRENEAEQQLDSLLKTIAEHMRNGKPDNDPNGGGKAYFSKAKGDTSVYGQTDSLLKESGSAVVNWLKQQRGKGLGTLTDLQIDQIYRDITGGAVNRYQKLRTRMESDRNDILLEAETKYEPMWEAMPKAEKAALSNLMHDATMARIHPDIPLEENTLYQEAKKNFDNAKKPETKAAYKAEMDVIEANYRNLSERYRLSSKQSKELYQTMRKLYANQWGQLRDAITKRIEDQLGEGGKALASKMRLHMEHALRHGPYFPLARFGDYVVKAKKGDEYIREHFERRKDAEAALKQYRSEGYNAVMTVKETRAGDQANAHALGMEVMELLDKASEDGSSPDSLKDAVWQAMLDMLPDASYAKHAIHRKRIKGASRDGHRAYLQNVYHFAHHITKIRYGHKMKAELDGMKEQVQAALRGDESTIKTDDVEIAQQVLNEMNLRHEMNMNPKGSALAGALGNFGFMFYLGASPASAVINLTQNATVMLPQLAGKYGFMKAAKFMLQALSDYMRHGVFKGGTKEAWVSLTRATNKAITPDEKALLNKLYKAGVLDLTQAHSIAARADTDQQSIKPSREWVRTGLRWAGALFHNAEVINREVAALTAYRLLKSEKPGIANDVMRGDDNISDQVAEMVYDAHGNYAASNRPRYMRSDVMKILTQFKIYSQMMTYTLARNAVLAAKGDKQALKTLGFMLGSTWIMAGMMGLPTPVGMILYGLASMFDDDDDRSSEASFRLGLTEAFGPELGELIAKGPMDYATGLNISGRTGLSDLWWRSPKEGTEGDDLTFHYVQQIAGPVLGIGVSAVRGLRDFASGDVQRGVEAMSPKAIKDLAKAYRQATEGEKTRTGDSIIDDVSAWNIAAQALGFSSSQMASIYSAREYIKGKEKIIEERRSNLLADYFAALQNRDHAEMADVLDRIREFNASHARTEMINGKTLRQSVKSRMRSNDRTQAGTYLSKNREYLRSEGAFLNSSGNW